MKKKIFPLPEPCLKGKISVEEALLKRRSVRNYRDESLNLKEVSQLLWSAQGITTNWGERTAPSAGATYPLEIYLVAGNVNNIEPGLYHYNFSLHSLTLIKKGDLRHELTQSALEQEMIARAPITIVICAEFKRTTRRYGERGIRYVLMEVGHVGQNIHLQAESLGLGTVVIGAFYDKEVKRILEVKEEPLYLMPVGKKL